MVSLNINVLRINLHSYSLSVSDFKSNFHNQSIISSLTMYSAGGKNIHPLPDFFCFCTFVTLHNCFRSSNKIEYKTNITCLNMKYSF